MEVSIDNIQRQGKYVRRKYWTAMNRFGSARQGCDPQRPSALGWNPCIIRAKFVVHEAERRKSMDALANQIADKIQETRSGLSRHDPVKQP